MKIKSGPRVGLIATIGLMLSGCAGSQQTAAYQGLKNQTTVKIEPWSFEGDAGQVLHSPHYDVYWTVPDVDLGKKVCDVMEGALSQYQRIAPGVPVSQKPMDCYVFATRAEWTSFTQQHAPGIEGYTYLKIKRGGYTRGDWYVTYFIGEGATLSVAAHEGWHQFANRNFKGRLPPFLEEGVATMFEDIDWRENLPRWNLNMNRSRLTGLRTAVQGHYQFSLPELVMLHAGNVVEGQTSNRVEAFYDQAWAFATFLWSAEKGKYRPALRQIMSDTADGTVFDPTGSHRDKMQPWNPAAVRPLLEHYLGKTLEQIDVEYQDYIRKVAFDEYTDQFPS